MKLKIFIGYDSREDIAYEVARASILEHMDAEVLALRLDDLREMGLYWRAPDPMSATEFSFSRFLVPALCNFRGRALFMDCDFLVRKSLQSLFEYSNPDIATWVVKHDYRPTALTKMDGQAQRVYPRKNWRGFMVCPDDYEPKEPQLEPLRYRGDAIALRDPRPDRIEPVSVFVGAPGFTAFQSYGSVQGGTNMQPYVQDQALIAQGVVGSVTVSIS